MKLLKIKGYVIVYKSKIILSSLTVLGLAGTGLLGSNYVNSVNADADTVKESIKQKVETIASQIDKAKPKEETKAKSTVYAEDLKPESVHEQLINNAVSVSESEDLKNDDIKSEDVKEEVVEEVKSETTTEQAKVISNETNNEVQETPIVEPVVETKVDEVVSEVKEEVKEESHKLEDTSVNEVVDTKVETEKPVVEETNVEATVAETPVVEEKHEDVKALDEIKPVETTTELKEEPKAEPVVEQPKEEPKVEETKVETPVVEAVASKPTLTNPINDKTNTYPIGQCTWGVKTLADWVGNYWGNANEWGASARKAGYTTGSTPQVGSVIVFPNVIYEGINYGHVAYVTHVYDDGSIEVLEANYLGNQSIGNYRGRFNPNQPRYGGVYYIYPNA